MVCMKAEGRVERGHALCERKHQVDQRGRLRCCALGGGAPQAKGMTDEASNATVIPHGLAKIGDVRRHHRRKFGARAVDGLGSPKLQQIRRVSKPSAVFAERRDEGLRQSQRKSAEATSVKRKRQEEATHRRRRT